MQFGTCRCWLQRISLTKFHQSSKSWFFRLARWIHREELESTAILYKPTWNAIFTPGCKFISNQNWLAVQILKSTWDLHKKFPLMTAPKILVTVFYSKVSARIQRLESQPGHICLLLGSVFSISRVFLRSSGRFLKAFSIDNSLRSSAERNGSAKASASVRYLTKMQNRSASKKTRLLLLTSSLRDIQWQLTAGSHQHQNWRTSSKVTKIIDERAEKKGTKKEPSDTTLGFTHYVHLFVQFFVLRNGQGNYQQKADNTKFSKLLQKIKVWNAEKLI